MRHETKVIPSSDDEPHPPVDPAAGDPACRGVGARDGGRAVVECPACGGPALLPGRPAPPPHSVIRLAVRASWRDTLPTRCPTATGGHRAGDQGPTEALGSMPLRGSERRRLPGEVEALPRRPGGLAEALERGLERMQARRCWPWSQLIEAGLYGTSIGSTAHGWPVRGWRNLALNVGARGLGAEVRLRRLWITCVHSLCTTYTSWSVRKGSDRSGPL